MARTRANSSCLKVKLPVRKKKLREVKKEEPRIEKPGTSKTCVTSSAQIMSKGPIVATSNIFKVPVQSFTEVQQNELAEYLINIETDNETEDTDMKTISNSVDVTDSFEIVFDDNINGNVEITTTDDITSENLEEAVFNETINKDTDAEVSSSDEKTTLPKTKRKKLSNAKRATKYCGRKKDPIWLHFKIDKSFEVTSKSRVKAVCYYCNEGISSEAGRLRKHIEKCPKRKSRELKAELSQPILAESVQEKSATVTQNSLVPLKKFVSKTSQDIKEKLDHLLGKFIFSANISFRTVENDEFKEFVKILRPSYEIPSDKAIGGSILNKVFKEIHKEVLTELNGKQVVLQQDGWSSTQNHPIVAHSVTAGNKNFFLEAISTGTNSKTAEYCQKLFEDEMARVEKEFGAEVIGCVTDNCNSMKSMRKSLSKKYPDLYVYGCNSHLLNLVGISFTPADLKQKIVKVQCFFRNNHFASASLVEKRGLRPIIPGDTRWNSQIDCFESFLQNQAKYLEISREHGCKDMDKEIKETIEDVSFYSEVTAVVKILKPVSLSLDKLQGEISTVADAVACWIKLKSDLDEGKGSHEDFTGRMKLGVPPASIASYMLHPKYRGENLTPDLLEKGNKFLESRSPYFVIAAANLKLGDKCFYPSAFMDQTVRTEMNPANWWQAVGDAQRLPKNLLQLAITLMKLPARSAGIERSFSALGSIMTKKRNKLDVSKGSKLCFIYQYFKSKNKEEVYIEEDKLD